jgi:deoxycytidylate deaminase
MLINAGIKQIIYEEGYPDDLAEGLLEEAGLSLTKLS